MEWQTSLDVCFVDFEKAFDGVDRQAIWDILRHYGVPDKIISVIRRLYEGFASQVIHSGRLSEDFQISTGVRQRLHAVTASIPCGAGLGDADSLRRLRKGHPVDIPKEAGGPGVPRRLGPTVAPPTRLARQGQCSQ